MYYIDLMIVELVKVWLVFGGVCFLILVFVGVLGYFGIFRKRLIYGLCLVLKDVLCFLKIFFFSYVYYKF